MSNVNSGHIDLNEILRKFLVRSSINSYGNGHINDTYLTEAKNYILQRINTNIFKNPEELMENIENVTAFLKEKIRKTGGDTERETMSVIRTRKDERFYRYDDNNCFRVYTFIKDTKTIEKVENPEDMYNAGVGFGNFLAMLNDYPVENLHETIKDFHNTPKRLNDLKIAVKEDKAGRVASVREEIEIALSFEDKISVVVDDLKSGKLPWRVTHNDTKINNVLFDNKTGKAVCVIDLDTVMPGSLLYDFGDALRIGASSADEDETNLDKVEFDVELFENFAKGYIEKTSEYLTEREKELLAFSAMLLTYECGIRFLTDYLNGDTYFKIKREHHNIDRARNQFKLVKDYYKKEKELNDIIKKYI